MTQIKINKSDVFELKTDALVLGVFEKTEKFTGLVQQLDEVFQNKISSLYSENEIRGKLGEVTIIHNFVGFLYSKSIYEFHLFYQTNFFLHLF